MESCSHDGTVGKRTGFESFSRKPLKVGDNKQSFEKRSSLGPGTRALRASGSWWQHVAMKITIQAHVSEY